MRGGRSTTQADKRGDLLIAFQVGDPAYPLIDALQICKFSLHFFNSCCEELDLNLLNLRLFPQLIYVELSSFDLHIIAQEERDRELEKREEINENFERFPSYFQMTGPERSMPEDKDIKKISFHLPPLSSKWDHQSRPVLKPWCDIHLQNHVSTGRSK